MPFPPPTDKQARLIWTALTGLAAATLVALLVALIWGLGRVLNVLAPVLWPIAAAGVLAYLLDPVVDFIERKGVSRVRAIICVFIIALGVVAALFASVVPQLVVETRQLVSKIPAYVSRVQNRIEGWVDHPPALVRGFLQHTEKQTFTANTTGETNTAVSVTATNTPTSSWAGLDKDTVQSATSWAATALPKIGGWLFGQVTKVASWFGVLAGLALIPVYAFYFLLEKKGIEAQWTDYLPVSDSRFKDELVFVLNAINGYLIAFFRGQVLVAICDGVLYAIGFIAIGLPYAILLGVAAIVLTMIPFLGAILTCGTALIIAIAQFGDWQHPLLVLGVFGVVQTLEGLLISPKILGDKVGLHPLAILIAVMAGTTLLGGILGGILAIPLTAALRVVMFRYVWKKREA